MQLPTGGAIASRCFKFRAVSIASDSHGVTERNGVRAEDGKHAIRTALIFNLLKPISLSKATHKVPSHAVLSDELLVIKCLRKDTTAWGQLFELCQPSMAVRVRNVLRQSRGSAETAEEIIAQVWLAIVADDGRLLRRFDARKGARVTTFLNGIATKQTLKHLRAARRRKHRETEYGNSIARRAQFPPSTELELDEFLSKLPPNERQACLREFFTPAQSHPPKANSPKKEAQKVWQIRYRIRSKFLEFFGIRNR